MADVNRTIDRSIRISRSVADLLQRRMRAAAERYGSRVRGAQEAFTAACASPKTPFEFVRQWGEYQIDAAQRSVLYWDTLRQRGNQWLEHEAAGKPPVLGFRYESSPTRARTNGPRITRSCASFRRTMSKLTTPSARSSSSTPVRDTVRASAASRRLRGRRRVARGACRVLRHLLSRADAPADARGHHRCRSGVHSHRGRAPPAKRKAVVVGNCQGGWAVMMLAAARPDIAGPLVINGAPMSYWSGNDGESPMRYAGGLLGGAWLSLLARTWAPARSTARISCRTSRT
jgi:hypothetical protein